MAQNSIGPQTRLVIIGGSAGSLEVILQILPGLRKDLSLALLIVLHRGPEPEPILQQLLSGKTHIPVKEAEEKELILPGNIYIAPADYHLLIEKDYSFSLDFSEKVNFSRPSIDVTVEIAAEVFGPSLTCILLSGGNTDGTGGLAKVKKNGGITAAQDPASASVAYMPQFAISSGMVDHVLDIKDIAGFINHLNT